MEQTELEVELVMVGKKTLNTTVKLNAACSQ